MAPDLLNASNSYYMVLRELFFRLVFSLQVESSLSMEIIAFWLWIQRNGQVNFLLHIYSIDENHFPAIVSSAKRFLEVLHFGFNDSDDRSIPRSDFQRKTIQGISTYLNTVCYEALEDLRERIEMGFIHNKMPYLGQKAYGEFMTDRVPASSMSDLYQEAYGGSLNGQIPRSSEHPLSQIKALYANTQNHQGEGRSSKNIGVQTNPMLRHDINDEVHNYQSTSHLTLFDSLTFGEKHNNAIMQQLSDVPKSSKHLLTKIKALYDNTPKHHGEGTSSRNIHAERRHIVRHDTKDQVYDYESAPRLVTLLDNLSLRENNNDAIMQELSDVPRDERTLFVTFSNGYPLTKDELHEFFMRHYGDVEDVSIEQAFENKPPLYAHVTFYSQVTLFRVLDGNMRVNFMTRGKHLRARQFVPKKKKNTEV